MLIRGSVCIFDCVSLLYYKRQKINFKHSGSYIDSSQNWIKKEEPTVNPKNDDDVFSICGNNCIEF